MHADELAFAGIARQAELIRAREVSSVELVDLYLDRIARIDPELNAFRTVFADEARAQAKLADERLSRGDRGPLLDVPVAFKDEVEIAGRVAMHGTAGFERPADADSEHVRRLRAAGAIVLGLTNLPELAICGFTESKTHGITRNPWDLDRTPGGSSGGSGAAVAAGLVGCASASDGAGSIRIPAANNGLFGLKPQRGRISLEPHTRIGTLAPDGEHWYGMTVTGCVSRRVVDTALWLDVAAGNLASDPHRPPAPERPFTEIAAERPGELRVGWSLKPVRALAPPLLDDEVRAAVHRVAGVLSSLGHKVERRDPDFGLLGNDFAARYLQGIRLDYERVPHPDRLEARTRGFARLARLIPGFALRHALAAEARHAARVNALFDRCDVLLTPTTGTLPVEVGRWEDAGALRTLIGMSRVYPYAGAWNYTGQPAAAVPAGATAEGLPLSVQLIAPPNREDVLLRLGSQLEAELGWPEHRPPLALA